jgi:hypothetical protein
MSSGQTTTMQPVAGKTIALTVLALGTFAIGTDGHIVIGLLRADGDVAEFISDLSRDRRAARSEDIYPLFRHC